MKINHTDSIKHVYPQRVNNREKTVDHRFNDLLRQTFAASPKDTPATQIQVISGSAPPMKLQPLPVTGQQSHSIIERVGGFLDILDEYRHRLGDPQVPLKEIDPLINELELQNANLKPVWELLPDGDELKEILNSARVTASLEVLKFKRGDYTLWRRRS